MIGEKIEQLMALYSRAPAVYVALEECVRRGHGEVIDVCEQGALVFEENSRSYLLIAQHDDVFMRFFSRCEKQDTMFLVNTAAYAAFIGKERGLKDKYTCISAYYPGRDLLSYAPLDIRVLGVEMLSFMQKHYSLSVSKDYLRQRLLQGECFGAFIDGELCGFIGTHDEGSMGMLEVFQAYRRMGIAKRLESFMINRHLQCGFVPFCQVFEGNEASLALQKSLGMVLGKERVYWVLNEAEDDEKINDGACGKGKAEKDTSADQ